MAEPDSHNDVGRESQDSPADTEEATEASDDSAEVVPERVDDGWGGDGRLTVFLERPKPHDPNRYDMYFNQDGGFDKLYGHVVETRHPDGSRTYHYARDEDGNEYIDDGRRRNRDTDDTTS